MTNEIKTLAQANAQFKRNLAGAADAIVKSHKALTWALLTAKEEQDLSQLDTMRAMVSDTWPTLLSRFDDYIVSTLDSVKVVSGAYEDGGLTFKFSKCAVLATPWNTRDRLKIIDQDKPKKKADIRTDVKRVINKMAKLASGENPSVDDMQGANGQAIADILKQAQAAIEAVCAGTFEAAPELVNNDVGNVTPLRKSA